jgi:hypothetical protein
VKLSISGIYIINGRRMNMSMAHLWNHKDEDKLKDLDKNPTLYYFLNQTLDLSNIKQVYQNKSLGIYK